MKVERCWRNVVCSVKMQELCQASVYNGSGILLKPLHWCHLTRQTLLLLSQDGDPEPGSFSTTTCSICLSPSLFSIAKNMTRRPGVSPPPLALHTLCSALDWGPGTTGRGLQPLWLPSCPDWSPTCRLRTFSMSFVVFATISHPTYRVGIPL